MRRESRKENSVRQLLRQLCFVLKQVALHGEICLTLPKRERGCHSFSTDEVKNCEDFLAVAGCGKSETQVEKKKIWETPTHGHVKEF